MRMRFTIDVVLDGDDYLDDVTEDEFFGAVAGAKVNLLDNHVVIHRDDPRVYCLFQLSRQAVLVDGRLLTNKEE